LNLFCIHYINSTNSLQIVQYCIRNDVIERDARSVIVDTFAKFRRKGYDVIRNFWLFNFRIA